MSRLIIPAIGAFIFIAVLGLLFGGWDLKGALCWGGIFAVVAVVMVIIKGSG